MLNTVEKFRHEMTLADCEIVENVAGPMMKRLGYKPLIHTASQERYDVATERSFEHIDSKWQDEATSRLSSEELRARWRQRRLLNEIARRRTREFVLS